MIWTILSIISIILLVFYFSKGKNSVWGGLAVGIILGLIVSFLFGFTWTIVGKWIVVCVLIGFMAELFGKLGDLLKRK